MRGLLPHTTAAITIDENADPDVVRDLKLALADTFLTDVSSSTLRATAPRILKSSVIGASETIPVTGGAMALGTWQGIYFCEFDGPRHRKVYVQVVGEQRARSGSCNGSSSGRPHHWRTRLSMPSMSRTLIAKPLRMSSMGTYSSYFSQIGDFVGIDEVKGIERCGCLLGEHIGRRAARRPSCETP